MGKINLGKNAKVVIKWQVLPVDRTEENEKEIKTKFAKKYDIPRENITIEPVYIRKNGDKIDNISGNITENIQEPKYQQKLFADYLTEHGASNFDFDKICEIDDAINAQINYEQYDKHKKYTFKWIKWKNFMSYGEDNYFDFQNLNGLVLLKSNPANQGGKSTFCLDLFRFLLFGKVTSRENGWTLARVFNDYIPEATECVVEGCITIDDTDYVIKRKITRPALSKRTENSKIIQKIEYYKIVDNNYVYLEDEDSENEAGSTVTETNKLIKEAIGNERDFDLMICVNIKNLEGLISLKDTDRGRLISRWIGLLPLEEKDKIARETYNKVIVPKLLLNKYDKGELESYNAELNDQNKSYLKDKERDSVKKEDSEKKLIEYKQNRDTLLSSKRDIDEKLIKADVATIKRKNEDLTEIGIRKKTELEQNKIAFDKIRDIEFNENDYKTKVEKDKSISIDINIARTRCVQLTNEIESLKKGEYCPTCGARLKGVNNTDAIKKKENEYKELVDEGVKKKEALNALKKEIEDLENARKQYNEKNRLELLIQKYEVDLEMLRSQMRENNRILKDIAKNEEAIVNNNKIDTAVNVANANIAVEEDNIKRLTSEIQDIEREIKANEESIEKNKKIIETILEEEKLVRNWKLYLEMIGKNGISKMVLRSALPLINSELKRLLADVCDFEVEIAIDDNNDVTFYKIHDGVKANLGSGSGFEQTAASLALRSVLSEISTFSKPSFVIFDEILGSVADENYDNIKLLYDRIVARYSTVFQITHLKAISDWHNKTVVITKNNNVSHIEIQ